jgi:lipopolysaccharide transport system ATP-binding protein
MNNDVVIKVDGLWKRYGLPLVPAVRGLVSRLRKNRRSILDDGGPWALRDVSFEVKRGETVGIIGRNGAGKSTLLKVLAGVTPPTRGQIEVRGRVFPMIELNAGLHMELTGRENVRLLGAVMGLSRREIEAKMPEIEEFCELVEWFDQPVRKYSSGMLARLGFGVAMNVDADILLVDEVLAVGDLTFQRKCYERIEHLKAAGTTIIIVSHNIRQVARLCEPVILLEEGVLAEVGTGVRVTSLYYERCTEKGVFQEEAIVETTGELTIQSVTLLDQRGRQIERLRSGDTVIFRLEYLAKERIEQPIIGIGILTADMLVLAGINNNMDIKRPSLKGRGWIDCKVSNIPLLSGIFSINVTVKHKNGARLFTGRDLSRIQVVPADLEGSYLDNVGLVVLDAEWGVSKAPSHE